ncbi:hypothetical protein GH714_003163 [Hevea brasiliensis]|uniref:Protein kinase domain-containing protein n=1 Tax=Hevea brasiliensis TaxID=3981 RepID=A0A6A6L8Q0_HEVBR|nr:hypothetical protein GH714_003163 [Hevea brasiliensis]
MKSCFSYSIESGLCTVRALTTFKEAIYEDPLLLLSNWNTLDADPCDWSGVICSFARDQVVKINITKSSIRGFLPPELGRITYLRELILHGNKLIGSIPKELGMLKNLKVLDLGVNQLTGPIPPEIANLNGVMRINLESNGLTGHLPPELGNLKYLEELRLDRNRLQGTIPASGNSDFPSNVHGMYASSTNSTGLCRATQLKVADLSYNFFVGIYLTQAFKGTAFKSKILNSVQPHYVVMPTVVIEINGASFIGGAPPAKAHQTFNPKHQPTEDLSNHHQEASKPSWLLALEIITGTMAGSLFLVAVLTAFRRCNSKSSIIIPWKKSASQNDYAAVYIDKTLKLPVKTSATLLALLQSLVYKGTIKGGPEIAVISLCIKEEHWTGYLELYFQKEVADLARLNHENTGGLLGYCRESTPFTRMLVFEYASNGTLYEHLHYGEGGQLSWTRRMKIVMGIARGLKYLHTELDPPFTISDLNSSAVYLTEDFSPKLVDFESWKSIIARSEKNSGSIGSQGAICVLPNSLEDRHLDVQGNVYAFGVLLLEMLSGRSPYCKDKGFLVDWAKEFLELPEVMCYLVDPELKHFEYEDLKIICEVVSLCIHPEPTKRPSMQEVSSMLESKIDTSVSLEFKASSLAWAELALSS